MNTPGNTNSKCDKAIYSCIRIMSSNTPRVSRRRSAPRQSTTNANNANNNINTGQLPSPRSSVIISPSNDPVSKTDIPPPSYDQIIRGLPPLTHPQNRLASIYPRIGNALPSKPPPSYSSLFFVWSVRLTFAFLFFLLSIN